MWSFSRCYLDRSQLKNCLIVSVFSFSFLRKKFLPGVRRLTRCDGRPASKRKSGSERGWGRVRCHRLRGSPFLSKSGCTLKSNKKLNCFFFLFTFHFRSWQFVLCNQLCIFARQVDLKLNRLCDPLEHG